MISTTIVNEKFDIYINTLKDAVDKFLPIEKTYVYASDKPWITGKVKSLIAKRQKLLKFGKDSPAYKEARNGVQKECENCKKCFYERKVAKLKQTNVRRWWKEIKGLTGLRCSESWVQQMLGDHLESTEVLANSFNILAGLTADFVPLPQIIPGSFFPVPDHLLVDTLMVYKALRGIKSNKSGGPDPIPGKVWKEFAFELSSVITNIYNASMVQGYVPVRLKQSEVFPVPKCLPPKVVEQDLQPISLTPHIAKVMEGLMLDSLFMQVCDKLNTHQFALAGKSTTHALVFFLQVILEALDQSYTYAGIFFTDFSKGFDLVDHNILIQEMELLGVHEAAIRWIGA